MSNISLSLSNILLELRKLLLYTYVHGKNGFVEKSKILAEYR